jgi:hypothetical protein
MFKRKKKLAPPLSPVRAVLVQADAALSDGREHLAEAEQRVVLYARSSPTRYRRVKPGSRPSLRIPTHWPGSAEAKSPPESPR